MKAYKRFVDWARMLALFVAVFIADIALRSLEQAKESVCVSVVVIGIVAILVMHLVELLAVTMIERWSWLRHRIVGDACIEGVWFDTVVNEDLYGIVNIQMTTDGIRIIGEQFDSKGTTTATWEHYHTVLDGGTLRVIYRSPHFGGSTPTEVQGMAMYVFSGEPGRPPTYYNGFFVDTGYCEPRSCQLRGYRISDSSKLARLREPHTKHQVVLELLRESRQ